jgi:ankyrin repeat protein
VVYDKLLRQTIFISSPGDVREERRIAKEVAAETVAELVLPYDVYDWNDEFFTSGRTFQEQIPSLTDPNCRVTICIFGERIGEPVADLGGFVPEKFEGLPLTLDPSDETNVPLTGSVYEYLEACIAEKHGSGILLVFAKGDKTIFDKKRPWKERRFGRRMEYHRLTANLDEGSPEFERRRAEYFAQTDALGRFYETIIGQRPLIRFESHAEFKTKVKEHLRRALKLGRYGLDHRQLFKGLESFSPRDHKALFGREEDARNIIQILSEAEADQSRIPFLMLTGKSGAGKSSLAKAGVAGGLALNGGPGGRRFAAVDADVVKLSGKTARAPRTLPWLARLDLFMRRLAGRTPRQDWSPIVHLGRRIALAARLKTLKREVERNAAYLDAPRLVALVRDFLADKQGASPDKRPTVPVIVLDQFEECLVRTHSRMFVKDWLPVVTALIDLARLRLAWVVVPLPSEAQQGDSNWPDVLNRLMPLRAIADRGLRTVSYELAFPQELTRRTAIIKGPFEAIGRPLADAVVDRILGEIRDLSDQNDVPVLPLIAAIQRWIYEGQARKRENALTTQMVSQRSAVLDAQHMCSDDPVEAALNVERSAQIITLEDVGHDLSLARAIDELGNAALNAFSFTGAVIEPSAEAKRQASESEEVLGRLLDKLVDLNPPDDPNEEIKPRHIHLRWIGVSDAAAASRLGADVVVLAALLKETRVLSQVRTDSVCLIHQNVLWHWRPAIRWRERRVKLHRLQQETEFALKQKRPGRLPDELVRQMEELLGGLRDAAHEQRLRDTIIAALKAHFLTLTPGATPANRLHAAITAHCAELVEYYLDYSAAKTGRVSFDLNAPFSGDGAAPPIVRLADARMPTFVSRFLGKGANPLLADDAGRTVLHALAAHGPLSAVQDFLKALPADQRKALVERKTNIKFTALHFAARHGAAETVTLLLRNGGNPLAKSAAGSLPAHLAAYGGHAAVIETLLSAEKDEQLRARDGTGYTPLMICAGRGHLAAVETLLAHDRNPLGTLPPNNLTALHIAAREGHAAVVKSLLKEFNARSLPQVVDANGNAPLHFAVLRRDVTAVETLLDGGASVDPKNKEDVTPLILACQIGDAEISRRLLDHGANPIWRSHLVEGSIRSGLTPLREAARFGSRPIVELILQRVPPEQLRYALEQPDAFGLVPLHRAAYFGHLEVMQSLLAAGAVPDAVSPTGFTPLHLAAMAGQTDAAALLEHRTPANQQTDKGRTSLHFAARNGHADVIEVLLEQDGITTTVRNGYGQTPLHLAAFYGHADAVRMLLRSKQLLSHDLDLRDHIRPAQDGSDQDAADPDEIDDEYVKVTLAPTLEGGTISNRPDNRLPEATESQPASIARSPSLTSARKIGGRTALYSAAQSGSIECVKLLVDAGADPTIGDANNNSPLHAASRLQDATILRLLLAALPSRNDVDRKNDDRWTSLHNAARAGTVPAISILLEQGADPRARTKQGTEPLHCACEAGHVDAARALIEILPPKALEATDRYQQTPLHIAARNGATEIVGLITNNNANLVSAVTHKGSTALHLAAFHGHTDVIRVLVAAGAELDVKARRGSSPLELASFRGHVDAVKVLLKLGADPNATDAMGSTPLHGAAYHDHPCVLEALLERGADATVSDFRALPPPHVAARAGRVAALGVFLKKVPLSSLRRVRDSSLLHTAASYASAESVEFLLKWRGPAGERFDPKEANADGRTPLHFAAFNSRAESADCVRLLLAARADPALADKTGNLPAHYAALQGSAESFAQLLRRAPQTAALRNDDGATPIHVAVDQRRILQKTDDELGSGRPAQRIVKWTDPTIFERIRRLPISWKVQDANGQAPIHLAIRRLVAAEQARDREEGAARAAVLRVVAQFPGAMTARAAENLQALHLAALLGSKSATAILLAGTTKRQIATLLRAKDAGGRTPLDCAISANSAEVMRLLEASN